MNILIATLSFIKKFYSAEYRSKYLVLFLWPITAIAFIGDSIQDTELYSIFIPIFFILSMSIMFCWIYLIEKFWFLFNPIMVIPGSILGSIIYTFARFWTLYLSNKDSVSDTSLYIALGLVDTIFLLSIHAIIIHLW